jgi:hypothetical protein
VGEPSSRALDKGLRRVLAGEHGDAEVEVVGERTVAAGGMNMTVERVLKDRTAAPGLEDTAVVALGDIRAERVSEDTLADWSSDEDKISQYRDTFPERADFQT